MLENLNVLEILRLGFVGIAFLLAGLAYLLLRREQERAEPRAGMLRPIYGFMVFALVLAAASLYTQTRPPPGPAAELRAYRETLARLDGLIDAKVEFEMADPNASPALKIMAGRGDLA